MLRLTAVALFLLSSAHLLEASLVVNGSFETPTVSGVFTTVPAGSSTLTGWTVGLSSVDVVNGTAASVPAFDGNQFLDLNGTPGPGSIAQAFATTPSTTYTLTFSFETRAPAGTTATVRVFDGSGNLLGPTTLAPIPNAGWTSFLGTFVATQSTATLEFSSLNSPDVFFGVGLDRVTVNAVPEIPASALMALSVLLTVARSAYRPERRLAALGPIFQPPAR